MSNPFDKHFDLLSIHGHKCIKLKSKHVLFLHYFGRFTFVTNVLWGKIEKK